MDVTWFRRWITALCLLCIAVVAPSAQAAPSRLLGNIDGVSDDGSGGVIVNGWACVQGSNDRLELRLQTDTWVPDKGPYLGTVLADQSAEDAVRARCGTADASHRFRFTLDSAKRKQYAGRPIHVSTLVKTDVLVSLLVPNPIPGSGQYTVPAPRAPEVPQDDTVYVISDRLGSEVILTDSHANVIFNVDYKAYGSAVDVQSKMETAGYTGHYEDASTGLTYMQARYYDADLGRFLSMDPAGVRPGDVMSFGRYTYADANPVNFVDPDGWQAVGVDPPKRADDHGGAGSSGGYIVQGYYWQERAGVSWSNTASVRGDGGGGVGQLVRTEPTIAVTATPIPLPAPTVELPPLSVPAWIRNMPALAWGTVRFAGMRGLGAISYLLPGDMATCQEPSCMPGLYYPGAYANEVAPPAGSLPISETPWSGDHGAIKKQVGAGPADNVKIDPKGNVWGENPDGSWTNHGPASDYTGSGKANGRRGRDRGR